MAEQQITPFLMFEGKAEEAINYYIEAFGEGEVLSMQRYGPEGPGPEGSVTLAAFSLRGQSFMAIDSFINHAFTFTPAISLYVKCTSEAEVNHLFERLSEGGAVLMPLDAYPFSRRYAWVQDKFGVSWQISLEA